MARRLLIWFCLLLPVLLCAAPTSLRVVELRWIKGQPELETWLGSLQGALNRQAAEAPVFLVRTDTDAILADVLVRTYGLKKEIFTPGALLETAKATLTGQVRYDPAQPAARARALTTAAAAPGVVIATHQDVGLPDVPLQNLPVNDAVLADIPADGRFANRACFARFTPNQPLLQWREEADITQGTELLALVYEGTGSLDDVASRILPLLDDPALARLPVGIEVPAGLADVPVLYQYLLARQYATAAEFLTAPVAGAVPPGARTLDCTAASLQGEGGAWPTADAITAAARGPWRCAFLRRGAGALPAYQGLPADFPVFPASARARTVAELRHALTTMSGPVQVLYLDPAGLPPSTVAAMLKEITYSRSLVTPSQAFRAREFTAVYALFQQQKANNVRFPDRLKPTLKVAAPTTALQAPTADAPIPVTVRVAGAAKVLVARVIYSDPTGRIGAVDLDDAGNGVLTATLPPMRYGGKAVVRARVVEAGGLGISLSPPLVLELPIVDDDSDGVDNALEAFQGSDPQHPDSDRDGLPDPLDDQPTLANRDSITLFAPIAPPADAPFLADAGGSTADAQGRLLPAGGSLTYRIPLQDLPTAGAALRLVTLGAGAAVLNGHAPVTLASTADIAGTTDLPVGKAGAALTLKLTAGNTPLRVLEVSLVTNPEGPYLLGLRCTPAVPPAGTPMRVRATVYDPDGVKAVAVRYGATLSELKTAELKPVEGTGNTIFEGEIPGQLHGSMLYYSLLAKDAKDNILAGPYSATPVGKTPKFSLALVPGRDLLGNWEPAPLWGNLGHALTTGTATDTRYPVLRPGQYTAWLLAMPRERGIAVRLYKEATLTEPVIGKLTATVPAGSPDGWVKLGAFSIAKQERLRMEVLPIGGSGFTGYGMLVLTQNPDFTPPLAHAGIDWYNSITLTGLTEGQTVAGDKITVTVQVTGNLDMVAVVADQVRGMVSSGTQRFTKESDTRYTLRTVGLPPGVYAIKATGYRIVDGEKPTELVTATVKVVIPEK
jgi:hypothetical protein